MTDQEMLSALETLARIKTHEPAMFGWISDAEPMSKGVRLRLRSPAGAVALVPALPARERLHELKLTLADLAARQDIARLAHLDARFNGQIVVRLTPRVAL